MPELTWLGKKKIVTHHLDVPYKTLKRIYSYDEQGRHEEDIHSENMIIHGDNLEALKALLPKYEGKIKCIYIDPPYNTGEEHWIYNDNVNDPRISKWLGEVVGKDVDDFTRHDKWLCMMYPRLKLLHRLLSEDGAIFISIDGNEQARLKLICDEIFGESKVISGNYSNKIGLMTLNSNPRGSQNSKHISTVHEHIYFYAKNSQLLNIIGIPKDIRMLSEYKYSDPDGRKYRLIGLRKRGGAWKKEDRENMHYPIYVNPLNGACSLTYSEEYKIEVIPKRPTGELGRWTWGKDKFAKNAHLLVGHKVNRKNEPDAWDISKKVYIDDNNGERTKPKTIWNEKETNYQNAKNELKAIFGDSEIFDYAKPTFIVKQLITMLDKNEDAIILDSFAGSGTTAHAVLELNKLDNGNRKFILVELNDYAETITSERVKRVIQGYQPESDIEEIIYDREIKANDLANGSEYLTEAKQAAKEAKEEYDKVTNPKLVDNHLRVVGTIKATKDIIGTGGNFSYYELGDTIINSDNLINPKVGIKQLREYIWYQETNKPLEEGYASNPYYLGSDNGFEYYFIYEPDKVTTLDLDFLSTLTNKSDGYVIFADRCELSQSYMTKHNIRFKKIPRDIAII